MTIIIEYEPKEEYFGEKITLEERLKIDLKSANNSLQNFLDILPFLNPIGYPPKVTGEIIK